MAGRTFGQPTFADTAQASAIKTNTAGQAPVKHTTKKMNWLIVGAAVIVAVLVIIAVYMLITVNLDGSNGAMLADEAALGFVSSLDDDSDEGIYTYVPRQLRSKKYVADTMNINEIRKLSNDYGVSLSNFVIVGVDELNDKIDALKTGLYNLYKESVNIVGAQRVRMTADMRYDIDGEAQDSNLEFNIICIKVNTKWYVYTGQALSENGANTVKFIETSPSQQQTVYDIVTEYIKPIVKDIKPLDFYDKAKSDLQSGKVTINDKEYAMPSPYEEMTDLYTIVESNFTDAARLVKPNYILKHLPIEFKEQRYAKTDFDISIGNPTDDIADVTKGLVTTLYIGRPESIYDYPDVYLPGNVTFGTTYADVVKMYGELDRYEPNDNLNRHSDYYSVYQLPLNNKRNIIYFEFDIDEKLVAVQYYYFDLNNSSDIDAI